MEEIAGLVWDEDDEDYIGANTCSPQRLSCIQPSSSLFYLATVCHALSSLGSGLDLFFFSF